MFRGLKKAKKAQILLALIISFFIPTFSCYLLYCDLADDNLFCTDAEYEHADIDDLFLVPSCLNLLKFFRSIGSTVLFHLFFPETYAIEQVSPFCSLSSCVEQKTLVLRC